MGGANYNYVWSGSEWVPQSSTIVVDSEFPAAAEITDAFANPTTTNVMSMGMVYNGATWSRALGDSTNGTLVNLGSNNDVTVSSTNTTSAHSPNKFSNLGADATKNVNATAGNVYSLTCHNENAADRYIQLHNTATVPNVSDAPAYTFLVPSGSQIIVGTDFFTQAGAHFSTGIAFAFSTTKDTYTAGTNTDQTTIIMYR